MNVQTHDYKGYRIIAHISDDGLSAAIDVLDPRDPYLNAVYKTTSLDRAMRWIDAYRDGLQWAIDEAI